MVRAAKVEMLTNGRSLKAIFHLVKLMKNRRNATIGHVYNCTERCIGRSGTPEPNTLVRYNSKLNKNRY